MTQKKKPMQTFKSQLMLTRLAIMVVATSVILFFGAECLSIQSVSSQYAEDLSQTLSSNQREQEIKVKIVTFSPNGKMLASTSYGGSVKLWSIDGKLITTLTGHQARINSVSFSPDGNRIVTTGDDKTVKREHLSF